MQPGMVIIGAGEAGVRAALALRQEGHAGPVTLVGDEAHAPYERPPLSKDTLTGDDDPQPRTIADAAALAAAGIEWLAGRRAVTIERADRRVVLADGTALAYDKLLLATGAIARRIPFPGSGAGRCLTLRSFDDSLALRRRLSPGARVAIIGGGFIGLELAASASRRGATVSLIEAQPRILARGVPAEIAEVVHRRHRDAGVALVCGTGIAAIEAEGEGAVVVLADGRRVEADLVVLGVGAAPVTALAEAANLTIDNGIAADATLRTSDPDIYAAGDCCSFPLPVYGGRRVRLESWRSAQEQGGLAARNMLGAGEAVSAVPWFWSDQHDLTLQVAGLADEGVRTVRRDLTADAFILFHLAADGRLVAAGGIGPGNAVARDIRLAEMLIGRRASPDPALLAEAGYRLKGLLAA